MADLSGLLGAAGIGGSIGQAIVRLELDTKKYLGEMKAAEGQTIASTNAMGTSTAKFGQFAQTALLGAGVAVVAFAASSVKAAVEANDAHLKLQNTFANNASLADSSVEAFERQADALRDLTGVDDEAIITSQALLGQFDLTGKQVMELTPLIVDLSEKMDIDLQAAAKAVGKATQGNAGILSRYGIVLDETALKTDAFGTTLSGLGVVQGFAADSAKLEPWRLLGAQFEELQETVGQALIPVLQAIVPVMQDVLTILQFVTGATEGFDEAVKNASFSLAESELHVASWVTRFAGHIPFIGEAVKQWDRYGEALTGGTDDTEAHLGVVETLSAFYRGRFQAAVNDTSNQIVKFAHLTSAEIKEWSDKTKESFDAFIFTLDESAEQTKITRREFINATDAMQREARQLARAMREIAGEKWINDEYIKFLSEQGPEWLIGFANLTNEQQHIAQEAWQESTRRTDRAKESLDRITGVLKGLDGGTSKHTVIIDYRYEGFDPSKPGMSAQQR